MKWLNSILMTNKKNLRDVVLAWESDMKGTIAPTESTWRLPDLSKKKPVDEINAYYIITFYYF